MDTKEVVFLNTHINNLTLPEILEYMDECIKSKTLVHLVSLNVDQVIKIEKSPEFKKIISKAELVITDGTPIMWMSKLLNKPIIQKLPGQFLTENVLEYASRRGYSVFLLGAKDGVARLAAANMETVYSGLKVAGTYSPPLGFENDKEEIDNIVSMLKKSKADILIVGLSAPKQERFVYKYRAQYQIPISMSVGAAIDFMAGNIKRAPKWVNQIGLEWLYRFLKEPKRLFKRYFIEDIQIVKLYFKYRYNEME